MRKRGYIIFTAVVLAAVLLLILLPKQEPNPVHETAAVADTLRQTGAEARHSHWDRRDYRHERKPHQLSSSYPNSYDRPQYAAGQPAATASAPAGTPTHDRRTRVNLNSADTLDWQQLYGIGPAFARRIVRYRSLLGGFVSKEQLLEVYGMDSARYLAIAPYIDIDSAGTEQLDINSATIDQLKRHPYLDYYQAKAIVRLREKEGAYQSVSDLRRLPVIDPETYHKILPYIKCNSQSNK